MKYLKGKNWLYLILAIVLGIGFIAALIAIPEFWYLGIFGIVLAVILALVALKPLFQAKNAEIFEGVFISIGLNNQYYIGAVFEVEGKDRKVVIPKSVFNAKRLAAGARYKITENRKNGQAISVERID